MYKNENNDRFTFIIHFWYFLCRYLLFIVEKSLKGVKQQQKVKGPYRWMMGRSQIRGYFPSAKDPEEPFKDWHEYFNDVQEWQLFVLIYQTTNNLARWRSFVMIKMTTL